MELIYIIIAILVLSLGFTRCIIFHLHYVGYYGVKDVFTYVKEKKWKRFNYYGIDMFIGMFGHGKTLSMTHKARKLYERFGDSIQFISNYKLVGIPYTPLINFNQLVELGEVDSDKQGTVVLIDEIEDVLSHRNYASFPLQLLHTLTQQRKKRVYILCSAQRFFMVDKLFRSITTHVIDCHKYWRLQHMVYYDAWDYENSMNVKLIKPMFNTWWFVKDGDFDSYDTTQMISRSMASDFISNEESIVRRGLDATVNELAINRPSKILRKSRKKKA